MVCVWVEVNLDIVIGKIEIEVKEVKILVKF